MSFCLPQENKKSQYFGIGGYLKSYFLAYLFGKSESSLLKFFLWSKAIM